MGLCSIHLRVEEGHNSDSLTMFRDCRDRAGAVRGAAARARPGHAARGYLQREGGEARHQGARAHQAAPQGEPGDYCY